MNFDNFLNVLAKVKHLELLGETSHAKMSPPYRLELAKQMEKNRLRAKQAGVLALFYPDRSYITNLVLILRKTYKGVHSAQVGFPGGKYEKDDSNMEYTAKRETEEEVGVPFNAVNIIRPLSPIYIPPSNFIVQPFMGHVLETPRFVLQEDEVEDILEVLIDDFLNEENKIITKVATSYNVEVEVPAFRLNGHIVWGATAMMLGELKDLLKQVI